MLVTRDTDHGLLSVKLSSRNPTPPPLASHKRPNAGNSSLYDNLPAVRHMLYVLFPRVLPAIDIIGPQDGWERSPTLFGAPTGFKTRHQSGGP